MKCILLFHLIIYNCILFIKSNSFNFNVQIKNKFDYKIVKS